MHGGVLGRDRELAATQALFDQARDATSVLILAGDAGIGKTTLCRAAAKAACDAGFRVLATTGAAAEESLAWAGLADLLTGIDQSVLDGLSSLHQRALQAVISGSGGHDDDQRLAASAFQAALEQQCVANPTFIVIDDAQWLDEPSRLALGFAVRRLAGPAALLLAFRSGDAVSPDRSWLQPPDPRNLTRLTLGPVDHGVLSTIVDSRLECTPPSPVMERIYRLSGGNPFYALELARAAGENPDSDLGQLPATLGALIRERIGDLKPPTTQALLNAAAAVEPTVEVIGAASGCSPTELVEVLEPAETRGLIVFDGARIRFTHPLIASGVLSESPAAALRDTHRRLAGSVTDPEQRARHLALSAPHGDPETLAALDAAAEHAAARGAYGTAAELVSLAIRGGGDDAIRRLRGGEFLFRAGSFDDAEALVAPIVDRLPSGVMQTVGLMLLAGIRGYRDGLAGTIDLLERAVTEAGDNLVLRTQARLMFALATGMANDMARCVEQARQARSDAERTGVVELRSQALALWVHVSFMYGLGTDENALREALAIEDLNSDAPATLQPSRVRAVNHAWTGRFEEARTLMADVLRRCTERGNEVDVIWAADQLVQIDVALGRYEDAEAIAADAMQRAEQMRGRLPLITAHTMVAAVAARRGRLEDTRKAAEFAVSSAAEAGLHYMVRPPLMSLAFVQVSEGRYEEALLTLKPLLVDFDPDHDIEMVAGAFLPDAIEAFTALGRTEEAEPLIAALETGGARHDRPWMLAVGARCRALLLAAQGDLAGALLCGERAMEHHERLPMPFERARSRLLLGQLQRRRRRLPNARSNLSRAAAVFEDIGSPLWAARARRDLSRLMARSGDPVLTDSERQAAEHAAAGLTNREIAATLYVSEKAVEVYLSNTYRKLGIRSRSQLADRLRGAALGHALDR